MQFSEWITDKYIEWRGKAVGHDRSISDFAKLLGVSQSLLSELMSGKKLPGLKTVKKISQIYDDINDALDLALPREQYVFYFAAIDPNRPSPQSNTEVHDLVSDILEKSKNIADITEKKNLINKILKEKKANFECYDVKTESVADLRNFSADQMFFSQLPDDWRLRFLSAQAEFSSVLANKGITANSPEGRTIINDILSKHGINLTFADET